MLITVAVVLLHVLKLLLEFLNQPLLLFLVQVHIWYIPKALQHFHGHFSSFFLHFPNGVTEGMAASFVMVTIVHLLVQ